MVFFILNSVFIIISLCIRVYFHIFEMLLLTFDFESGCGQFFLKFGLAISDQIAQKIVQKFTQLYLTSL